MSQYRYYGKGAHMSADLKRIAHDLRMRFPERYVQGSAVDKKFDADNNDKVVVRTDAKAAPMDGRTRHSLATRRD